MALALALAAVLAAGRPVPVRWPPGTLHGFPSLSDVAGPVIADGELTQEVRGDIVDVRIRWTFRDGRRIDERDEFRTAAGLRQTRFSWTETRAGEVRRHFEADLSTGRALAVTRDEKGDLQRDEEHLDVDARTFAGYGTALAVGQLDLADGAEAEIGFVAFTPKPREVTLGVRREREERVGAAGRSILCDRFTVHPKIPFPLSLFAGAQDGHLWFTHRAPPALVRAAQNLMSKDDPVVVVDVVPRGSGAQAPAAGRPGRPGAHRPRQAPVR